MTFFLKFVVISCSILLIRNKLVSALSKEDKRLNVILIICDDLNDWVLHPPGHPGAKVPNLDRLRDKSITFTNAHVAVPVCAPSRKCLLSGLYPQTINNYDFAVWKFVPMLQDCVPLPLHFRNNGYEVYGTGKMLHEGMGGDFYTEYGIGPNYGPWPWTGKDKPSNTPNPDPRQYNAWTNYLRWGMHRDLNYGPLSNIPEWKPNPEHNIPGAKGWYNEDRILFRYVNDNDRDKMPDEISADWAVNILNRKHDKPFFLGVGFIRPHTPLYAPEKYFKMFPLESITLPPYLEGDLDDCAEILRNRWEWGFMKFNALIKGGGETAWKEWVQAYLACMSFVDDQIGKVLDALETSPYRDNTIIILTGDNGYHIGEKDCIQKWHLWEESTRVPLFIHAPEFEGNGYSCTHPASLINVYPTLVDLCNLPKFPNKDGNNETLDGYSLRPFLENPECTSWEGPSVALTAIEDRGKKPHFSVRSDRYRYILCSDGEEELYDHVNDPNEWINLVGDSKYQTIKKQLNREMMKIFEKSKVPEGYGLQKSANKMQ